jgi:pentatricopeptide repeat protein
LFQAGRVLEAKELLKDMYTQGHSLNLITYSILLDGLIKQGCFDQALGLFRDMQNSYLKPDLAIYNITIDAMCKSGKLKDARELFLELSVKGLQPNVRVWTTIINGLCKEGLLDEAYKTFRQMEEDGCPPDNCSYNVFIRGLLQHKDPRAVQLISEMTGKGFSADVHTTELVVDDDLVVKQLLGSCEVHQKVVLSNSGPSRQSLAFLLCGC